MEVVEHSRITRIPNTKEFMKGIINIRGAAIPILDIMEKLSLNITEVTKNSSIIIIEVTVHEEKKVFGIITDDVHKVVSLNCQEIEAAPKIGTTVQSDYLEGIGKIDNHFLLILDVEKILSDSQIRMDESEASESHDETIQK